MKGLVRRGIIGLFLLITTGVCNAKSLWKQGEMGFGTAPAAAIFSINGGAAGPSVSSSTQIIYFSASDCNTDSVLNDTILDGSFTFNNPQIVQADARSIYNIGSIVLGTSNINSVTGIMVDPFVFVHVGRTHCFPVTCGSGQCIYDAPATPFPVSLS